MRLADKTAIVTGAARGIGKGIAAKLAAEGAHVIIADIDEIAAWKTAEEIAAEGGEAIGLGVDVTQRVTVEAMVHKALERYGKIDILVNNVGWDKIMPFLETTEEFWERVIDINLKGTILCCHTVLPYMVERAYGKVVNIGSDAGRTGSSGEAIYSAAKGGVIALTKTLAREMARHKINVNCVCPGPSDTPLFDQIRADNEKIAEGLKRAIPFRRLGEPKDIANAVAFLASDEAEYITGQTLSVSGGLTMM